MSENSIWLRAACFLELFYQLLRSHCRIKAAAVVRLSASGCIDVLLKYACFTVLARRKTARSRANDGVYRQSLKSRLHRIELDKGDGQEDQHG